MNLILQKFPGFKNSWQEHLSWWDNDVPGLSNDMTVFSDYVINLLSANQDAQEIKEIFIFIENLLKNGDQAVSNAVATCFLENLLNAASWNKIRASSFVYLLEPESKKYCKAWDKFTGIKTEGLWLDE